MTRIKLLIKSKVKKGRTALYMNLTFLEELEAIAESHDMSLNLLCLSLLEHGVEQMKADAPKKTRKRK